MPVMPWDPGFDRDPEWMPRFSFEAPRRAPVPADAARSVTIPLAPPLPRGTVNGFVVGSAPWEPGYSGTALPPQMMRSGERPAALPLPAPSMVTGPYNPGMELRSPPEAPTRQVFIPSRHGPYPQGAALPPQMLRAGEQPLALPPSMIAARPSAARPVARAAARPAIPADAARSVTIPLAPPAPPADAARSVTIDVAPARRADVAVPADAARSVTVDVPTVRPVDPNSLSDYQRDRLRFRQQAAERSQRDQQLMALNKQRQTWGGPLGYFFDTPAERAHDAPILDQIAALRGAPAAAGIAAAAIAQNKSAPKGQAAKAAPAAAAQGAQPPELKLTPVQQQVLEQAMAIKMLGEMGVTNADAATFLQFQQNNTRAAPNYRNQAGLELLAASEDQLARSQAAYQQSPTAQTEAEWQAAAKDYTGLRQMLALNDSSSELYAQLQQMQGYGGMP